MNAAGPTGDDPTTDARIEIDNISLDRIGSGETGQPLVSGFSVSLDILQLGDPFSLTLPNPRGRWTEKIRAGAAIKLRMANPNVNGGRPSLMHTGRIVGRELSCEIGSGSVMQLRCADLGWHLMNQYPLPHQRLEESTFGTLLKWATQEPTWGIKGVTEDTATTRNIWLGLIGGRAAAEATASNQLIVYQAQVEPGQTLGALLITFAKRFNRMVNMTPDGYLQVFQPNYTQKPLYRIDLHEYDNPLSVRNNALSASLSEDIATQYSSVNVVGQVVGYQLYDRFGYNPGKFIGHAETLATDRPLYRHDFSLADGELWDKRYAKDRAGWEIKRGLFDAWEARYRVRGHWQAYAGQANWWVPDTMCEVNDEIQGVRGVYYVSAVKLERTRGGDTTEVTLKRPYLLSANYINVLTGTVS